jgi:hypothetical protein
MPWLSDIVTISTNAPARAAPCTVLRGSTTWCWKIFTDSTRNSTIRMAEPISCTRCTNS